MKELLEAISIVMLIWGILNIILFFKIWGMTNNIKTMKNIILSANSSDSEIAVGDFVYSFRLNQVCMVTKIHPGKDPYECVTFDTGNHLWFKEEEILLIKKRQ